MNWDKPARSIFDMPSKFLMSVARMQDLPILPFMEVAFSGRSNSGKSSLINAMTRSQESKKLAFTSKTPGRTQTLNFIQVGSAFMLVDLPGYGFAKVPDKVKRKWGNLNSDYILASQDKLATTIVLIDSRRGPMEVDFEWMCMLQEGRVPFKLVLTKADKVTQSEVVEAEAACRQQYQTVCGRVQDDDVIVTSSKAKLGLDALKVAIVDDIKRKLGIKVPEVPQKPVAADDGDKNDPVEAEGESPSKEG